ncbi:MAG TPA: HEPN domain-containing protein [Desulfobacteraceae bacterium]|nr:HEPN domain-containing protein [Desulfobacteraceae bacterium]
MITGKQQNAVIQYWYEKAQESLASAKREFEAESLTFAMNRIYYAAFYAVSALLMSHNLSFKKHSGVRAAFHQKFVKSGPIETKWGKFYDRLFEDRQEGDYVVFISFDKAYVKGQLTECALFLERLRPLIFSTLSAFDG